LPEPLPAEIESFLEAVIDSFEHLAILLLMRQERDRSWSPAEAAQALGIPAEVVQSAITSLLEQQLLHVVQDEAALRYVYAASGARDALVERLNVEYAQNPARLMRLLSAQAIQRVRTSAIRAFADSFILKKKDPDRG
jgi:hypothetical protein